MRRLFVSILFTGLVVGAGACAGSDTAVAPTESDPAVAPAEPAESDALAADERERSASPTEEAKRSLDSLKRLVKKGDNWRRLRLRRAEEVESAEVGSEVNVSMVRLDKLRSFSGNPATLLEPSTRAIVTMKHQGQVEAGFFLERRGGAWRTMGFGRPELVKRIHNIRGRLAHVERVPESAFFVVHVAALNQYFLGHGAGMQMRLTPLVDDRVHGFRAGEPLHAVEVFNRLKVMAQRHNGQPS